MGTIAVTRNEVSFLLITITGIIICLVFGIGSVISVAMHATVLLMVLLQFIFFVMKRKEVYFLWSIVAPRITGTAPILSNLLWAAREEGPGGGELNDLLRLDIPFLAPMFFIFKPTYLRRVLKSEANNFTSRGYTGVVTKLAGDGNNILLNEGPPNPHWARFREVTSGINRDRIGDQSALAVMFGEAWKSCQELTHLFDDKRSQPLDLFFELFKVMVPAHNRALFGEEHVQRHWNESLAEDMYHIITENGKQLKFPYSSPLRERTMMEQVKRIRNAVLKMGSESTSPFIRPWHDAVKNGQMSSDEFRSNLLIFEYAQAPLHVAFWVLYMLALHPDVEKQIISEIAQVLSLGPITYSRLSEFKYMSRVISETLRLFPGVGLMQVRFSNSDCMFGSHFVPEGSYMFLSPYLIHRNASYWENPDEFDPSREGLDVCNSGEELTHIPFGYGPRQCQGQYFAQDFMKATLISLLQNHQIHLVPGQKPIKPTEIGFCRPEFPVFFHFSERVLPVMMPSPTMRMASPLLPSRIFSPPRSPNQSPYSSPKSSRRFSANESEEENLVQRTRARGRRTSVKSSSVGDIQTFNDVVQLRRSSIIVGADVDDFDLASPQVIMDGDKEDSLLKSMVKRRRSVTRTPSPIPRSISELPDNSNVEPRSPRRHSVVRGMPTYSSVRMTGKRKQSKITSLRSKSLIFRESFKSIGKSKASKSNKVDMIILWGSQSGHSHSFALRLAHMAKLCKISCSCISMALCDIESITKYETVIIVTSTYGDGGPPENAEKMCAWLESDHASNTLSGVNYAVLSLGSTLYTYPFAFGNLVSQRFMEFGARRLIDDGKLDDQRYNENEEFRHWSLHLFEAMTSSRQAGQHSESTTTTMQQALLVGRNKILGFQKFDFNLLNPPFYLEFTSTSLKMEERIKFAENVVISNVERNELVSGDPTNQIFSISLNFPEKAIEFQPGDNIAVLPTNEITLVRKLITRLGFSGDLVFTVEACESDDLACSHGDSACTLEIALSYYYDIAHWNSKTLLQFFALNCSDENDQQTLLGFASNFPAFLQLGFTPLDVLEMFPSIQLQNDNTYEMTSSSRTHSKQITGKERNLAVFLGLLKPLSARYYSVANSPLVNPASVQLIYKKVEYISRGGQEKQGLCSSWLTSRKAGDKVAIFLSKSKFKLPQSDDVPIIMIGAGTGISPYFGFLEHRQALCQTGKNIGKAILIHGCRAESDFPYMEKLNAALKEGALTYLWPAYSRMEGIKTNYVQHVIERESEIFWKYITHDGAILYSCGDIKIGIAVRQALVQLAQHHGGLELSQAKAWLQNLSSTSKLRHDEWGTSLVEQS